MTFRPAKTGEKMNYNNIAIIGLSLDLPEADTLDGFHANLAAGRDLVREIPKSRVSLQGLDENKEYIEAAYIEDIDKFDNRFFGISDYESDVMCPEQRMSLQLAVEAVEDAGYSLEDFKGKNCGVFFGASDGEAYYKKVSKKSSTAAVGNVKSVIPGRIGYCLDVTGPCIVYDTGCSSSLVAVHEACEKLMISEIDYALVGGIHIMNDIDEKSPDTYDVMGLGANDFRSHSFGENSSGVGLGEGGCCILLKRLVDAERDGDPVYGVIKSGCVNGDGGRCSSVTIPSTEGQREVIEKAWKDTDPRTLTEIEAHGIGTQIGDSVEVESLLECMRHFGIESNNIYLSSVKSSIGHIVEASGVAGIAKVISGFDHNITYQIAGFDKPNKNIDFTASNLIPLEDPVMWDKEKKRAAGVDSFGLSGANVHVIIENYEVKEGKQDKENKKKFGFCDSFLKLSAKTETAFAACRESLLDYINRHPELSLKDIVCTLNTGRDDYRYRRLVHVGDMDELKEALELMSPARTGKQDKKDVRIIFCLKAEEGNTGVTPEFEQLFPALSVQEKIIEDRDMDFKYRIYKLLADMGIKPDVQLVDKNSKILTERVQSGKDTEDLKDYRASVVDQNYEKIGAVINRKSEASDIVVLNFGRGEGFENISWKNGNVRVFDAADIRQLRRFVINYYNSGHDLDWKNLYGGADGYSKIHLPPYQFDKISHWMRGAKAEDKARTTVKAAAAEAVREKALEPVKKINKENEKIPEDFGFIKTPAKEKSYGFIKDPVEKEPENTAPVKEQAAPEIQETGKVWGLSADSETAGDEASEELSCIEGILEEIWREAFDLTEKIGPDEDFFELGGSSLLIQQISKKVNKRLDTEFDIYEIYDYPTIRDLSKKIMRFMESEKQTEKIR